MSHKMNKLDEKIINWSQQQFNIKVNDKKSLKSVLIVINFLTYNSYKYINNLLIFILIQVFCGKKMGQHFRS